MLPRIFLILLLIQCQAGRANPKVLCERIYGYNQSLNRPLGLDKIENIQSYKFLGRGNPGRGGHVYLAQATDLSLSVYKIYDNEKQALNDSKILNFLFQEKESGQPLIMDSFKIPRTRTDNESWGPRLLQLQYIKGQTVQSILRDTTGRHSEGYKKLSQQNILSRQINILNI